MCNLNHYESTLLLQESFADCYYEDDYWFAGYCLATDFEPTDNPPNNIAGLQLDYILDLMSRGFDYEWSVDVVSTLLPF